jgi:hypothetical protein
MLAHEQMRFGAQIMAAIFGGPGVFYVVLSFQRPRDALTGLIYLVIATTLALYAGGKPEPRTVRRGAVARCKAILLGKRRP